MWVQLALAGQLVNCTENCTLHSTENCTLNTTESSTANCTADCTVRSKAGSMQTIKQACGTKHMHVHTTLRQTIRLDAKQDEHHTCLVHMFKRWPTGCA